MNPLFFTQWSPNEAFNYWLTGDFVNALVSPLTGTMGNWFYAFLLLTVMMASWLKTRSIFMVGFLSGIYTIVVITVLPLPFLNVIYWAIAFAITVVLYKIFVGRE